MGEPGGLPDVYGVAQSPTRLKRLSSSILSYFFERNDPKDETPVLCPPQVKS